MTDSTIKLYGVPGSHPTALVEGALRAKGLRFERRDRLPLVHRLQHKIVFGRGSAPAIRIDGRRLVGSLDILAELDRIAPDPPMYPAPDTRELAEWGEQELQNPARRLIWAGLKRRPDAIHSFAAQARMPIPTNVALLGARPMIAAAVRVNHASDDAVAKDLERLPAALEHADEISEDDAPNAATLQVASSVALLGTMDDLADLLDDRPSARLAHKLFPDWPGRLPAGALPRR